MEVPDPDLTAQAAAGNDAGMGRMELDAPGGAGVTLQGLQAAARLCLCHIDVMVTGGGGHHRPVRREHHQEGGPKGQEAQNVDDVCSSYSTSLNSVLRIR